MAVIPTIPYFPYTGSVSLKKQTLLSFVTFITLSNNNNTIMQTLTITSNVDGSSSSKKDEGSALLFAEKNAKFSITLRAFCNLHHTQ
jgi:desulfoferrodoxin (superoxide reductase-like protein)